MAELVPIKSFNIATDGTTNGGEVEIPQTTKEIHVYATTLAILLQFFPATGSGALAAGDNTYIVPAGLAAPVVLSPSQSPRPNRNAGGIIPGQEAIRNYRFLRYDAVAASGTGALIINCLG